MTYHSLTTFEVYPPSPGWQGIFVSISLSPGVYNRRTYPPKDENRTQPRGRGSPCEICCLGWAYTSRIPEPIPQRLSVNQTPSPPGAGLQSNHPGRDQDACVVGDLWPDLENLH